MEDRTFIIHMTVEGHPHLSDTLGEILREIFTEALEKDGRIVQLKNMSVVVDVTEETEDLPRMPEAVKKPVVETIGGVEYLVTDFSKELKEQREPQVDTGDIVKQVPAPPPPSEPMLKIPKRKWPWQK